MLATEKMSSEFRPAEAETIEQSGLGRGLVLDLLLKHAYVEGAITLGGLTQRSKLSATVVHGIYRHLQKEQLCETKGMVGEDYEITLTARGRTMAETAFRKSQYAGPAPVPLAAYNEAVVLQSVRPSVTGASLGVALSDLTLPQGVVHSIGAALMTGGALLLYGGTGNGKTSIAERLHRVFPDRVYIPYAVEASGHVLNVYDPAIHQAAPEQPFGIDGRWVLCERPMVKVGGELRADMLEPRLDEFTRICVAPLQMKANNGILLIDDFGRQRITPRELLNRWIVPLDRRTDVMSLWSGVSFEIPFDVLVVFATNLSLSDLAEEAFMRRLKNKIRIDTLSPDLFRVVLAKVCEQAGIACSPDIAEYIVQQCSTRCVDGLRACLPGDLVDTLSGIAAFEQREPRADRADVERALNMYFAS
jgi:hypothetical protein